MLPGLTSAGVGTLAGAAGVPGGCALADGAIESVRHTMGANANLCTVIFTVIGEIIGWRSRRNGKQKSRYTGGRLAGPRIEEHQGAAYMRSLFVGMLVLTAVVSVSAQSRKPAVPRTADGHPDLQGTWDFAQLTPFERPGDFAGKDTVTEEEAEEFAQKRIETTHKDRRDGGAAADVERAYNDFWWDFGRRIAKQPSLVVDPPDGRVPALLPEAQKRIADRRNHYDNPEERPLAERCILGFNSGPPMVPSAYNNNVQIVQTRDRVLILNEMIHSARIVDLSGRPHHPKTLRFLTGDSVGRWEGDTLVVDTTNFSSEAGFRG